MQIGKYITNIGIISTLFGAVGVAKQTKRMPNDWRRYLIWAAWGITLVLAIASVQKAGEDKRFIEDKKKRQKAEKKEQKRVDKALKKAGVK